MAPLPVTVLFARMPAAATDWHCQVGMRRFDHEFDRGADNRMLTKGLILCLTLLIVSCDKRKNTSPETQPRSFVSTPSPLVRREWGEARFKVCALLSQQEVAEVQQGQIKETKSAGGSDDSLFISQCFYLTPDMQLS